MSPHDDNSITLLITGTGVIVAYLILSITIWL